MKNSKFLAHRFIMTKQVLFVYQEFLFALDTRRNSPELLRRNDTVINACVPDLWQVLSEALFFCLFTLLSDLLTFNYEVEGSVFNIARGSVRWDKKAEALLKSFDMEKYLDLIKRIKLARDKYIVHSEIISVEATFPIKVEDLYEIGKLLVDLEKTVVSRAVKEEGEYIYYSQDKSHGQLLEQFEHLMNILEMEYLVGTDALDHYRTCPDRWKEFIQRIDDTNRSSFAKRNQYNTSNSLGYL